MFRVVRLRCFCIGLAPLLLAPHVLAQTPVPVPTPAAAPVAPQLAAPQTAPEPPPPESAAFKPAATQATSEAPQAPVSQTATPQPVTPQPVTPQPVTPPTPPPQAPPGTLPPGWALVPIQPQPKPSAAPARRPEPPRRVETDQRQLTIAVGPLLLGNVHWLDRLGDKQVSVGTARGTDERYPGFVGSDVTIGAMLDLRYAHVIGVEIDLFRQNDRGTGDITVRDTGSICYLPSVPIPYRSATYRLTIGQSAWHVPLLLKLAIPGRKVIVHDEDVDREFRRWFATLAFGPEFVFPDTAKLEVSPESGLDFPLLALASNYVMYTGALGAERRVSDRHDIRLLFSLRGSYFPGAGSSAPERGDYAVVNSKIVPIAYRSEWRYQAALTFGVGWFF